MVTHMSINKRVGLFHFYNNFRSKQQFRKTLYNVVAAEKVCIFWLGVL